MELEKLPRHVAIIMDGNGRWAKAKGEPRRVGHEAGTEAARKIVTECRRLGIGHLTLYTFSKENWARPQDEVRFLFDLLVRFLKKELSTLLDNDIRFGVLGEVDDLPLAARQAVKHVMAKTAGCSSMVLNLALNYSGRFDLVQATRKLVREGVRPEDIDEDSLRQRLYSAGQPDPDLVIRTSGECRTSGFLLYEAAYAELYFTKTLWPDFDEGELMKALEDYAHRQRRFGQTGEQAEG
jgi:undecaprenyl diphosphate synthase